MTAFELGLTVVMCNQCDTHIHNPDARSCFVISATQIRELRLEEELIASSVEDMVEKSIRLASDPNYRRHISSRILGANYRLFDSSGITREWESFLERALVSATP